MRQISILAHITWSMCWNYNDATKKRNKKPFFKSVCLSNYTFIIMFNDFERKTIFSAAGTSFYDGVRRNMLLGYAHLRGFTKWHQLHAHVRILDSRFHEVTPTARECQNPGFAFSRSDTNLSEPITL